MSFILRSDMYEFYAESLPRSDFTPITPNHVGLTQEM